MYSNKMALAQYKKIDNESAVNGASPHRLIQMLMTGALDRMAQAVVAFEAKNIERKGVLLGKSISIIAGLQASLDNDRGANVAVNLDKLYDYMQRRLLEANLKNDMAMVEEVSGLLVKVKTSWDAIAPS
jgi:flagellar protein FliS